MKVRQVLARVLITPLAIFGTVAIASAPAQADPALVPLTGEFLSSLPPAQTTSGMCNPTGETTFTFTVSGTAAGPYVGTFTETGTVTFGPVDIPNPNAPGQFRAEVLAFSADFTIVSALGTVTGHKELPPGAGQPVDAGNAAGCLSSPDGAIAQVLTSRLEYTAVTPTGTDSGSSWVNMNSYPNPTANSSSLQFREGFFSQSPPAPQCSNLVDDDGDGFVDYPADPGCTSAADTTESPNPPPPPAQCANGLDDDGDGLIDYPADPGCESATDETESPNPPPPPAQCANGLDDDADGFVDYPADPGCESATDDTESPNPPPPAQCANGVDDDGDGDVDFPADPGCESATDDSESPDPGPASVTLSPPDAVNTVGTTHTVTATVRDEAGRPVEGTTVLFSVQGSITTTGSCTTDAAGQCSFTYQGPGLPGADMISGCADVDDDGTADPGEPCGSATKAWVLPTATAGQVTGGGQVANATASDSVAFGFNARADEKGVRGNCTVVDPATGAKIKCLDVTTVVQAGNHVTFFGNATVNGVPTTYRIDVDDNGEPGRTDVFTIQTASGYTVGGVIERGNIQIH